MYLVMNMQDIDTGDSINPYEIEHDSHVRLKGQSLIRQNENASESVQRLHRASFFGKLDVVKLLLEENRLYLLQKDHRGDTALHYAVYGQQLDIIKYLIEVRNCNPVLKGAFGETPLHLAARRGYLKIVTYLVLEQCVDLMLEEDHTPLDSACIGGNLEVVRFLVCVFNKFQPIEQITSHKTKDGCTPLFFAIYQGHIETVKYFLSELKCDPNMLVVSKKTAANRSYINKTDDLDFTDRTRMRKKIKARIEELEHSTLAYAHAALSEYRKRLSFGLLPHESLIELQPLDLAAGRGHVDIMKYLINEHNCDPSKPNNYSNATPLHYAASGGSLAAVKFLAIEKCCDVTSANHFGRTPLSEAAFAGHLDVLKFFVLDMKCDPTVAAANVFGGATPLHFAALGGHVEIMTYLIEKHKCSLFSRSTHERFTPLHYVLFNDKVSVVKFLTQLLQDKYGVTVADDPIALLITACYGKLEVLKFLITEMKCDPHAINIQGRTLVHHAAGEGHIGVLRYLIFDVKCIPSPQDSFGFTPLHIAAYNGQLQVVKFFIIEIECDPNVSDKRGSTPLHLAASRGHVNLMSYLIFDAQCNPFPINIYEETPLHHAALNGHLDAVKFLITETIYDPNVSNRFWMTPLHLAASHGCLEIVKFLITDYEVRCDPTIVSKKGMTPLHCAAKEGHVGVMKYLMFHAKYDLCQLTHNKKTPLHLASAGGHLDAVKFLTSAEYSKFELFYRDSSEMIPLHCAVFGCHLKVVAYFISELNCEPNVPCSFSELTPLHIATLSGHLGIMDYLINTAKCNLLLTNLFNMTPFHYAAVTGQIEAIIALSSIECCANTNLAMHADIFGNTPLHYAAGFGHLEIVQHYVESLGCPSDVLNFDGVSPIDCAIIGGHRDITALLQAAFFLKFQLNVLVLFLVILLFRV